MENLKIRVNSEAESKEAQELFFELGYQWAYKNIGKNIFYEKEDIFLYADKGGNLGTGTKENQGHFNGWCGTLVSLPELRALVSLHKNPINMDKVLSEVRSDALGLLEEKEYLRRNAGGTYSYIGTVHPDHVHDLLIEIPEGANYAYQENGVNGLTFFKDDSNTTHNNREWFEGCDVRLDYVKECEAIQVWQRHAQPEALPFLDDEPYKPDCDEDSLPDFLFEDTVNHPSHYASGEIECIDAMEAMLTPEQFIGYLRGNAFKYQWRYENKGGVTDLEKAQWYLNKLISRIG